MFSRPGRLILLAALAVSSVIAASAAVGVAALGAPWGAHGPGTLAAPVTTEPRSYLPFVAREPTPLPTVPPGTLPLWSVAGTMSVPREARGGRVALGDGPGCGGPDFGQLRCSG